MLRLIGVNHDYKPLYQCDQCGEHIVATEEGSLQCDCSIETRICKYITFVWIPSTTEKKTRNYAVCNNKSNFRIGMVKWYPSWRQYCFLPQEDTVYSYGCLQDINKFLDDINTAHKRKNTRRRKSERRMF